MKQLFVKLRISLRDRRGSTLVGAIVISLILAISGLTYLWVVRNAGQQEFETLRDTQGLYAAESGLQIATRLLSQTGLPEGKEDVIAANARIKVNTLWVDADVEDAGSSAFFSSSASGLKTKKVNARAWDAQTGGTFVKRVSWYVRELNAFEYGFFSNGIGSNGNKEFCGQQFYGDTYLTSKNATKGQMNLVCSHPEHGCNKYYAGLSIVTQEINEHKDCKLDSTNIENDSTPLYKTLLESVTVPPAYTNLAPDLRSSTSAAKITLSGTGTLIFNPDGSADFGATHYASIEGKIFVATATINVQGTVKGSATVVSAQETKITISGNLVYDSYSSSSATAPTPPTSISSGSNSYLGIVTDGGVVFDNAAGPLQVSAAIVAWNPASNGKTGIAELEMTDNKSNNARVTLTGTVLLGQMEKDFSPFTYVQDHRLKKTVPPGFPPGGMVGNLFRFEIRNWEESSSY